MPLFKIHTSPHIKKSISFTIIGLSLLLCSGIMYVVTAKTLAAPPQPAAGLQWNLSYADEFDGTSLDTTHWSSCYRWYVAQYDGCTSSGNNELQWYMPAQVTVANGYSRLTAEKKVVSGTGTSGVKTFNYVSGMIATGGKMWTDQPKWTQQYGYFESRIKVPAGTGLLPAFWLLPQDYSWPPEIDIMELLGQQKSTIFMTYHYLDAQNVHQNTSSNYVGSDFTAGWHTYAVNWQPGKIDWYIDGTLKKSYTSTNVTSKSMYILLNLAVGGNWPGNPDASTVFPAYMDIDYVHVYQLGSIPAIATTTPSTPIATSTGTTSVAANSAVASTAPSGQPTTSAGETAIEKNADASEIAPAGIPDNSSAVLAAKTLQNNSQRTALSKIVIGVLLLTGLVGLGAGIVYARKHHVHMWHIKRGNTPSTGSI